MNTGGKAIVSTTQMVLNMVQNKQIFDSKYAENHGFYWLDF